jgi:hypothetical protein
MGTTVTGHAETKTMPQSQEAPEKRATSHHPVDRFADARRAKKKARRVRHRAKLKRSHTKG